MIRGHGLFVQNKNTTQFNINHHLMNVLFFSVSVVVILFIFFIIHSPNIFFLQQTRFPNSNDLQRFETFLETCAKVKNCKNTNTNNSIPARFLFLSSIIYDQLLHIFSINHKVLILFLVNLLGFLPKNKNK